MTPRPAVDQHRPDRGGQGGATTRAPFLSASPDLSTPAGATLRHPRDCECTWCCDRDMARANPIVELERAELGRARAAATEAQRAAACGHLFRARGVCPDCGDQIDWEEA